MYPRSSRRRIDVRPEYRLHIRRQQVQEVARLVQLVEEHESILREVRKEQKVLLPANHTSAVMAAGEPTRYNRREHCWRCKRCRHSRHECGNAPRFFSPYAVRMESLLRIAMASQRETTVGSTRRRPENEPRINRRTPLPPRQRKRPGFPRIGRHRRRQLLCALVRLGVVRRLSLGKTTDPGRSHDGR